MNTRIFDRSFTFQFVKLCLSLNKNKKDAPFKHHGNNISQARHIKIHHSNQLIDIDQLRPNSR